MSGPQRCAFCHDDAPDVACAGCGTALHRACWSAAGRCPTLGCGGHGPPVSIWRRILLWGRSALVTVTRGSAGERAGRLVRAARERQRRDDLDGALKLLDEALELDPEHVAALYHRAHLRSARGEHAQALTDARRSLGSRSGRHAGGVDYRTPRLRADMLVLAGEVAERTGDEAAADELFDQIERLAAEWERAGFCTLLEPRAAARALRWDLEGALGDLFDPRGPAPDAEQVALLLRQQGRLAEARAVLDRALDDAAGSRAVPRGLLARWELRVMQGDPDADRDLERALEALGPEPRQPGGARLRRAIAAVLQSDDAATLAFAAAGGAQPLQVWRWSVALGLPAATEPPVTEDRWEQALTDRLLERLDDTGLLASAQASRGPRTRARRLHEAHALLALVAFRKGDRERELAHLRRAAELGDMGEVRDVWIHARARELGADLPHRPPRPVGEG